MLSMAARCLVVLYYSFYRTNGANMAVIKMNVTAITEMVRGKMEAVPLDAIVGQPTLNSV